MGEDSFYGVDECGIHIHERLFCDLFFMGDVPGKAVQEGGCAVVRGMSVFAAEREAGDSE